MTREEAKHIVDVAFGVPQAVRRVGEDRTYHECEIREAKNMAIKALEQEDVPDINVGDIYKCPCGYGWDKSKVVRHHFCPNCGRAVNSSYNSIKAELKPCEDAISRQGAIDAANKVIERDTSGNNDVVNAMIAWSAYIKSLPPVNSQPKTGHWEYVQYDYNPKLGNWHCSECRCVVVECADKKSKGGIPLYKYCPQCGCRIVEPLESEDKE